MKSMTFSVGFIRRHGVVEITNRKGFVEYKIVDGYSSEGDARRVAGNFNRGRYAHDYSGSEFGDSRRLAVKRLESDIEATEKLLEELRFCLNVTKKKKWMEAK